MFVEHLCDVMLALLSVLIRAPLLILSLTLTMIPFLGHLLVVLLMLFGDLPLSALTVHNHDLNHICKTDELRQVAFCSPLTLGG